MDKERKKRLEIERRRRFRARIKNSPDLSPEEVSDLQQLTMMLGRSISNENEEKFVALGLARQGLGGTMITSLGKATLSKYPRTMLR
ncbi:MAG: hypothetical protein DHS20C02_15780 [Micavibrio sp.]|nr:MAG: hypothetical protein DHS20C02_15780 [Micavibrio sp.]